MEHGSGSSDRHGFISKFILKRKGGTQQDAEYSSSNLPATILESSISSDRIDLSSLGIRVLPPQVFPTCGHVVTAKFSGNCLSSLPPQFRSFTALRRLHLDDNQFDIFPTEIFALGNLSILSLESNKITAIPAGIAALGGTLSELHLGGNKIDTIPPEIEALSCLESLTLANNNLCSLPSEIGKLTFLRELTLHDNSLSELPSSMVTMLNLHSLTLHRNKFHIIPDLLAWLPGLHEVSLYENPWHPPYDAWCRMSFSKLVQRLEFVESAKQSLPVLEESLGEKLLHR